MNGSPFPSAALRDTTDFPIRATGGVGSYGRVGRGWNISSGGSGRHGDAFYMGVGGGWNISFSRYGVEYIPLWLPLGRGWNIPGW